HRRPGGELDLSDAAPGGLHEGRPDRLPRAVPRPPRRRLRGRPRPRPPLPSAGEDAPGIGAGRDGRLGSPATSAISSISTQAPWGSWATPNALRACVPRAPKTATSSSEAPLATRCCSVNVGALLTSTSSLAIRRTR